MLPTELPFRRAVVTGGAGFVGSHVCDALLAAGVEVVCVDNFLTGLPENLEQLSGAPGFQLVEADVGASLEVDGELDLVLHLASPASPADYLRHPLETMAAGSEGTRHALELAERSGARFVLASTSETYGDPHVHPQPETYWGHVNPVGPRAVYDEAKRFAEALTAAYRRTRGVDTAIVRLFNTYGPRMRAHDGRAVPTFVRQALAGEPLTVTGDGSQTRSLCYVDDTVRGILAVARSPLPGPVNVGNPDEMTVLQLAERIRAVCGSSSPIERVPAVTDDPRTRRPDTTLIERELGWRPQVPWRDGLSRTVRWFAGRPPEAGTGAPAAEAPLRVTVIGSGALGATHAAVLAQLGHQVVGIDTDAERVAALRAARPPFREPGLEQLLERHLATGRLRFATESAPALREADVHFVCVGTPQRRDGAGADLRFVDEAVAALAEHARPGSVVVGKSTVPAGTAEQVARRLGPRGVEVAWNPEFLREGRAVQDSLRPDRIVIGVPGAAASSPALRALRRVYRPLIAGGVRVQVTDYATAELAKVAANSFLATKVSFANAMEEICAAVGADAATLADVLGSDPRIGRAFLDAGPGFGGGCLPKDLHALTDCAAATGARSAETLLGAVDAVNGRRRRRVVERARTACGGTLAGRRAAVLGAAFKAGTDDVRESPALDVAVLMRDEGASVRVYDPAAGDNARKAVPDLEVAVGPDECCAGADVVLVLTEWPQFARLDPRALRSAVRNPVVLDTRGVLDAPAWAAAGWRVL